jgi:diguanylate cyclase (GGDEF)-like protein
MFIDLDGFKTVNDSMGHDSGDLLLQAVARRLKNCLRKSDTVARMGGDEFTCILPDIKKSGDISVVAQKIIRALSSPFNINGNRIYISGSIGASIYPDDAGDVQALIKNADVAMYDAKKQGKNNFQFFAGSTGAIVPKCILVGNNLNNAPERKDVPALVEVGKQPAREIR